MTGGLVGPGSPGGRPVPSLTLSVLASCFLLDFPNVMVLGVAGGFRLVEEGAMWLGWVVNDGFLSVGSVSDPRVEQPRDSLCIPS